MPTPGLWHNFNVVPDRALMQRDRGVGWVCAWAPMGW
jgi:hypothetical protein